MRRGAHESPLTLLHEHPRIGLTGGKQVHPEPPRSGPGGTPCSSGLSSEPSASSGSSARWRGGAMAFPLTATPTDTAGAAVMGAVLDATATTDRGITTYGGTTALRGVAAGTTDAKDHGVVATASSIRCSVASRRRLLKSASSWARSKSSSKLR